MYGDGMTAPSPAPARGVPRRSTPAQLGAYFVLTEAVSLLQHQVEQQLRTEGGISYVQFQLLARLAGAHGPLTMTQLADGVVYSRSGLTYQAGLLEKAGLITRGPSPDDERATLVTITDNGRALFGRVLPGHIQVIRRLLFDPLTGDDLHHLGDIMTRVRDHMRAQPPRSAAPRKAPAKPRRAGHSPRAEPPARRTIPECRWWSLCWLPRQKPGTPDGGKHRVVTFEIEDAPKVGAAAHRAWQVPADPGRARLSRRPPTLRCPPGQGGVRPACAARSSRCSPGGCELGYDLA